MLWQLQKTYAISNSNKCKHVLYFKQFASTVTLFHIPSKTVALLLFCVVKQNKKQKQSTNRNRMLFWIAEIRLNHRTQWSGKSIVTIWSWLCLDYTIHPLHSIHKCPTITWCCVQFRTVRQDIWPIRHTDRATPGGISTRSTKGPSLLVSCSGHFGRTHRWINIRRPPSPERTTAIHFHYHFIHHRLEGYFYAHSKPYLMEIRSTTIITLTWRTVTGTETHTKKHSLNPLK